MVVLDIQLHLQLHSTGLSTVSAAATAIVSTAGTISAIHITNAGAGYSTPPTIAIAPPAASDAVR